jgi:IS4 transposase
MAKPGNPRISLSRPMELIQRFLTQSLAEEVWGEVRRTERVRVWGLGHLALFWSSVVMHAPRSLRAALVEAHCIPRGRFSAPQAVPQAFFARSQHLSWRFFEALFAKFRSRLIRVAPRTYGESLKPLVRRFRHIEAVDGSRLDPVRRRLKILWKDRRAVLGGSIVAFYDFATGTVARLVFDPVVKASEFLGAERALEGVARGTLLVGDRLYGVPKFFQLLSARGLFGVARRFSVVKINGRRLLSRTVTPDGLVEDWEVSAGSGNWSGPHTLRLIRLLVAGRVRLELFTNVLDPRRLSANEALRLYRHRWSVERLFSDLKEVLRLNRFYGANANSVGMQVFAAAIVHTALRVAQALAAIEARVPPEVISPQKFFPKAAAAAAGLTGSECTFLAVLQENPRLKIRKPDWHKMDYATTRLDDVRVELRHSRQGRGRRRPGVRGWTALPTTVRIRGRPRELSRRR